ncbi:MAG: DUF5126 domain-containing protein [Bacteroidales bacterium]|nr:DUF5126 domain-containing protein [Bacteroidales bacterium]
MKYINCLIAFLLSFIVVSCEEEYVGQYPVDSTAPKNVSNVVVNNIPGGAVLTYDLPKESDLMGVKVIYTLPNGNYQEMMSSAFSSSLTIKGFGKSTSVQVKVVTMDKSYNTSDPIFVDIQPLDSPVYNAYKSLKITESFGGLKLEWENEEGENIVANVIIKDEENKYRPLETIYSSEKKALRSVRGLDNVPTDFGFFFRDTYNNYTDTLYLTLTPIHEVLLDKTLFRAMTLSPKFKLHSFGKGGMPAMWDNITATANNCYYIMNGNTENPYFTMDLGVYAKLSRFKLWHRADQIYKLHSPRNFEIWTTYDETKANDPDNWDGWELVSEYNSSRPSGIDSGDPTGEDVSFGQAGIEYDIPIEAKALRYIRLRSTLSWGGGENGVQGIFIAELSFYGSVVE